MIVTFVNQVFSFQSTYRNIRQIGSFKPDAQKIRMQLSNNLVVTLFVPKKFLKLVDCYYKLCDTEGSCKQSVFLCRSLITLPSTFKLLRLTIDNQNSAISLGGSCNHICDEISVAGCIKYREISIFRFEEFSSYVDGYSSLLLFLCFIHNIRKLKSCFAKLFSLFLMFSQSLIRYLAQFVQQVASQC